MLRLAVCKLTDAGYEYIGMDHFAAELERLRALHEDGLVQICRDRIVLTPVGRLLMRTVAMVFDAYLGAPARVLKPESRSRVI